MNNYLANQGSSEVKLLTIWTDGKAQAGRSSDREKIKERISDKEKVREKMQVCEKVEKSRNIVFSNILWLWRVESKLAKAAGAEPAGQMRNQKVHAVVARSTFRSN